MARKCTLVRAAVATAAMLAVLATAAAVQAKHVPEVERLLAGLTVEPPRTHKNMLVFPIRWSGQQAPGDWETLDTALAAGHLKVLEKAQASVPEVVVENTGEKAVFLMSGEIIQGGKQTRVIRKDTLVEPKQQVSVPVFCVEQGRWAGGKDFKRAANIAPASIQNRMNRGADQAEVWDRVRGASKAIGAESPTQSLDEVLESAPARQKFGEVHKDLGKFSPPDTVGIAVADARTGRVMGVELFGRRDLFDGLQEKLVEGYAADLVLTVSQWDEKEAKKVAADDVLGFIALALKGTSGYEDTPGSGRGLGLESGSIVGKGVALGDVAIHVSVQDVHPETTPARPIVTPPRPMPPPVPVPEPRPPVRPPIRPLR
ncbi:MAG: hypothetical protein ISS74_02625 [Planctomycetes bacterium]|nr:hypothetical protein [Planctomycetota bacterium]